MLANLLAICLRFMNQNILRGHQHTRRAVSTLKGIARAECCLKVRYFPAIGQSLDRLNGCIFCLHGKQEAGTHGVAIDANRARSAHAVFTADMRSSEPQLFPQEISQIQSWQYLRGNALAVDRQRNWHEIRHTSALVARS